MASVTSQLIVRLIDQVTGPAKGAAQSLQTLGRAANAGMGGTLTERLQDNLDKTTRQLDAMRARMAETVAVGYTLKQALQAPIDAATKLETLLLDIGQKAEMSDAQLKALGQRIKEIAPTVNQTAMDIATAMDTLLGMGMKADTAQSILPILGKTATAYRAEVTDLAKTAMAAIDNLKLKAEELPRAMDMIARAGMEGAFELRDMAQYLPAIAAMAEVNGMRGIAAIGELGAALQITRKGAGDSAEAATNLRNVLQKLTSQEVVKKFKDLGGIDLKKQIDALVKKGISPLEAIIQITRDVIEKSKGKVKISDLFTDMQMQLGMASLTQHYDEFKRIRAEMFKNSAGLIDKDFARRIQTMEARVRALNSAWEIFKIAVGDALAPSLIPLLLQMTQLATRIADVATAYPAMTNAAVTAIAALVGGRMAVIGISWALLTMRSALLTAALAATTLGRAVAGIALAGFAAIAGRAAAAAVYLRNALAGLLLINAVGGAGTVFATLSAGLLALLNPMRIVRAAAVALRAALMLTGVGLVIGGIAASLMWIANNWQGIKVGAEAFGSAFMSALGPAGPAVDNLLGLIKQLWSKLQDMLGPLESSVWQRWGEAGGKAVGELVAWFATLPSRIIEAVGNIDLSKIIQWPSLPWWMGGSRAAPTPAPTPSTDAPARATGGPVSRGASYWVGERGPELITAGRSGYVNRAGSSATDAGGIMVAPVFNMTFNGRADSEDVVDQIRRVLRDEVRETFRGVFSDTSMRFA